MEVSSTARRRVELRSSQVAWRIVERVRRRRSARAEDRGESRRELCGDSGLVCAPFELQSGSADSASPAPPSFGGAGPLHASAIARSLGIKRVIVPPHPGLSSAFGALLADIRVDKTWTNIVRSDRLDAAAIDEGVNGLVRDATEELRREGYGGVPTL